MLIITRCAALLEPVLPNHRVIGGAESEAKGALVTGRSIVWIVDTHTTVPQVVEETRGYCQGIIDWLGGPRGRLILANPSVRSWPYELPPLARLLLNSADYRDHRLAQLEPPPFDPTVWTPEAWALFAEHPSILSLQRERC
jgi:hypothetical protein